MEILLVLILTYPASYLLKLAHDIDVVKDAAKNGYLANIDAFKKNRKEQSKENKYLKYIPIVNVLDSAKLFIEYKLNRQESFENYRVFGYLESMTKEEEEYYNKKPTALRAFNLASLRTKQYSEFEKENLKSNIRFYNNTLDEHDYVVKENDEYYSVDLTKYIETLDREKLESLRNSLMTMSNCQDLFGDDKEGDYTLSEDKGRSLILRYRCQKNDKNQKTST